MTRTLVVADSGAVMAAVTAKLCHLENVEIVAYASGHAHVDAIVRATAPDVVLIDEMCWPGLALARVAETRAAWPPAVIIGLAEHPDTSWVLDGLRAGAAAVVPRDLDAAMLALVLREALAAAPQAHEPRPEERSAA
jgi:DNA-binding NarL/FixJ family response regulator